MDDDEIFSRALVPYEKKPRNTFVAENARLTAYARVDIVCAYREMLLPFNASSSKDLTDYLAEIFIYQLETMAVKMGVWENPSLKYEDLRYREEKMASPQ